MATAKKLPPKATPSAPAAKIAAPNEATFTAAPAATKVAPATVKEKSASLEASVFSPALNADILKPLNHINEQLRANVEKGIEQFRNQYASLKGNAETATDNLETSLAAAQAGTRAFQTKMLDVFRAQAEANFSHLTTLFSASSLSDAIKIQQDFAKSQVESIQTETRALAELAQKVVNDVSEPVKASLSASFAR